MLDPNEILNLTDDVESFHNENSNNNSGFVEAEYTSSGVVLRATKTEENNLNLKDILKLI